MPRYVIQWCAIYTRQSRESDDEFSSCQAQLGNCLEFVWSRAAEGWRWNELKYDDYSESSETLDRPGLKQLLNDVRAGKIHRVIVQRFDRLSRRVKDSAALLNELQNAGIPLTVVSEPELNSSAQQSLLFHIT